MSSEFSLIQQYFSRPTPDVVLGVGDDCALLQSSPNMHLAVSTDSLVAGVHFFHDADPALLGWKSLAVNLSDLAAMGATPRWCTLAISLPEVDESWLAAYADGLYHCADAHQIRLVGGDTTRGPLNLSLTVMGEVPINQALRRDGAQVGDAIWVSGDLGDAAFALAAIQGQLQLSEVDMASLAQRLHAPVPRVSLGLALRQIAHSAIDISDGLLADLGHILSHSRVSAVLHYAALPTSEIVADLAAHPAYDRCVLAGGDDYELCFTAPVAHSDAISAMAEQLDVRLTCIGEIVADGGMQLMDADGQPMQMVQMGYDHFVS
ncbi:thiamine-phosphate kinase [Sulfuriferula nivalis]|uniref:Thiamine-monophosphate kinase n=1 Tax=Sulfuriferula nivalis TaxID=2675298 RepID=A0A809S7S6_9PROT|nr:thiamine-phosphate kinase [Sulfuriferula nivalis]BBP00003.1 thiamine-monophosphate kinase [Sulfuriferula nivalis]